MGIFVGIGNYIGRVRQIGDGGGQPIGPNDYYIITEDEIAVLTERGKHILLDKYVTEDEIAAWVKEHMVFWYDMSKPVDVYAENFNDWTKHNVNADVTITSNTFTITRFTASNDVVKCYIPSGGTNFLGMKVTVEGLLEGQEIYWGYSADVKLVNITSDGTYDIPPLETVNGNLSFRNGNIVGACNITITQLPSRQSVPTNEILKANPYLQDFSGNNRPLKLNNFLFAGMSGVGGYEYNYLDSALFITYLSGTRGDGTITDNTITINNVKANNGVIETRVNSPSKKYKVRVTGITSNETLRYVVYGDTSLGELATIIFDMKKDGEYELPASTYSAKYNMKWQVIAASYPHTCNITIEQIPSYPNALVTDGVDDYGQVQNLQQGVKMLFTTINPFVDGKFIYDQRFNTTEPWLFAVFSDKGSIAYNSRNSNGKTYIDGVLNESTRVSALLNKKQIITITNNDVVDDKTKSPVFFSNSDHTSGWINSAFYNSIGFDAVPEGNVTLQRVINYVINNILNKA